MGNIRSFGQKALLSLLCPPTFLRSMIAHATISRVILPWRDTAVASARERVRERVVWRYLGKFLFHYRISQLFAMQIAFSSGGKHPGAISSVSRIAVCGSIAPLAKATPLKATASLIASSDLQTMRMDA